MQIDLTLQGWTALVNFVLALIAILIPQSRAWYGRQNEEYQRSVRGIASLGLAALFIGSSCAGWLQGVIACERTTVLGFIGNVVIAGIVGFQASGALFSGVKTSQAVALNRMIARSITSPNEIRH